MLSLQALALSALPSSFRRCPSEVIQELICIAKHEVIKEHYGPLEQAYCAVRKRKLPVLLSQVQKVKSDVFNVLVSCKELFRYWEYIDDLDLAKVQWSKFFYSLEFDNINNIQRQSTIKVHNIPKVRKADSTLDMITQIINQIPLDDLPWSGCYEWVFETFDWTRVNTTTDGQLVEKIMTRRNHAHKMLEHYKCWSSLPIETEIRLRRSYPAIPCRSEYFLTHPYSKSLTEMLRLKGLGYLLPEKPNYFSLSNREEYKTSERICKSLLVEEPLDDFLRFVQDNLETPWSVFRKSASKRLTIDLIEKHKDKSIWQLVDHRVIYEANKVEQYSAYMMWWRMTTLPIATCKKIIKDHNIQLY